VVCHSWTNLELDFIQARAGSQDIDSLGWTDREFSCLGAILDHKREGATKANAALGIKYRSGLLELTLTQWRKKDSSNAMLTSPVCRDGGIVRPDPRHSLRPRT
jgi:hypothetical protein